MNPAFEDAVAEEDIAGALRLLLPMRGGPARTAALLQAREAFASRVQVSPTTPGDHVLLRVQAPAEADQDWDGTLQFAGYKLEENGMPTLHRSTDPYSGDPVRWVLVFCPAADEAAWRAVAAGIGAAVTKEPLGDGVVLLDLVAGTGHGRAVFPGPDGWEDWWWSE